MPHSEAPLNLVSFASGTFKDALHAELQAYRWPVRAIQGNDWLLQGPQSLDGPTVLALGSNDFARDRLLARLRERWLTPALAVMARDWGRWDTEILPYCREFLGWPCRKDELALRLARGCQGEAPSPAASSPPDWLEEFAPLNLIGQSPAFLTVLRSVKKLARCEAPVLLTGETGTGKELAARAIHALGPRSDQPFIPLNCGTLPDELLANELFGHERGAYTDAKEAQPGLIAQAHGGTLFLDEVESLSPKAQVSLLRFLQDQTYQPVGGRGLKQANVRLIAATNADLPSLIKQGQFRQDLWFRLQVLPLALPPLRERPEDIERLAHHFLQQCNRKYQQPAKALHPCTLAWMRNHAWPGNVRELENWVHRLFLLSEGPWVDLPAEALAIEGQGTGKAPGSCPFPREFNQAKVQAIAHFEKQYLEALMAECQGNVSLAARRSGKERRALDKLLKKYQIDKTRYRPTP